MPTPSAGFLIVRTFEFLYHRFVLTPGEEVPFYAIPRQSLRSDQLAKKYRGIDRVPLGGWPVREVGVEHHELAAEEPEAYQAMDDLEEAGRVQDDRILSLPDAQSVLSVLREPNSWEIIWTRTLDASAERTGTGVTLGYEPTWLPPSTFSALCDSMCFPRWHGTDREGTLFSAHFARLNEHALFDSPDDAAHFLRLYRSQDWTETGDYIITEVCLPSEGPTSESQGRITGSDACTQAPGAR